MCITGEDTGRIWKGYGRENKSIGVKEGGNRERACIHLAAIKQEAHYIGMSSYGKAPAKILASFQFLGW